MNLKQFVDEETGEILVSQREVLERYESERRQRHAYKEKLERERAKERGDHRQFLQVYNASMGELNKDLSLVDAGLLLKLSLNLRLGFGNMLVTGSDKRPLKKAEIGRIIGRSSKSGIDTALKRLINLGVVRKEERLYFISEDVVSMGSNKKSEPFTKVYRTQAKEMLDKLTDSEAGFILKATAYVSHNFLVLAYNPREQDETKLQSIRQEDLAELLGVEVPYISTILSGLRKKGAAATFSTGVRGNTIILHPYICDRGNDEDVVVSLVAKLFRIAQS